MGVSNRKYDVIPALAKVAKSAAKEKVIRVIIATFRVSDTAQDLDATTW